MKKIKKTKKNLATIVHSLFFIQQFKFFIYADGRYAHLKEN